MYINKIFSRRGRKNGHRRPNGNKLSCTASICLSHYTVKVFYKEFFAGFYALRRPYNHKGFSLQKFVCASVKCTKLVTRVAILLDVLQSCCNLSTRSHTFIFFFSLNFQECAHKMMKMQIQPSQMVREHLFYITNNSN